MALSLVHYVTVCPRRQSREKATSKHAKDDSNAFNNILFICVSSFNLWISQLERFWIF